MKSPEGKRLNGQTCTVVKVTKTHIEVTISGAGRTSTFVEKDGTMKKFILKPENLSPKTSFSGFSFGKDCRETKKNIPQGNAFNFEIDTKSNSFTNNSFSFVDNLKNPSKFSLTANNNYTFYTPFSPKKHFVHYTLGQRDKEIAALKRISLFFTKKKKKRKIIKKQRADAVTLIRNGLKSHVHAFIMKKRVAIKITAAVISTKSRQLRCRSMARKIQKCVRTIYNRHMASKMIQKVSEP